MVAESSIDSQLSKDLGINGTCIDSPACNFNQINVGSGSDCVEPMTGVISKHDLLEANGQATSGFKRARMPSEDPQAAVHVRYEYLSSESKKKLEEVLSDWSKWHAKHSSSAKESKDALESGGETFFPALHCGTEKSTVSFLMETQAMKKQKMECVSLKCDSVPLYDRDYAFALKLTDGSNVEDRGLNPLNASRCFNCGSYSHSLKECPKPRDSVAVTNARKEHHLKKNYSGGPHATTRYYQDTPRGKYDGLKPGALDTETRKLLGLTELDPPPWLNRMRELGYPPGYLDIEDADQPSGITIFDDKEYDKHKENVTVDVSEPSRTKVVAFPGINAPIPENADQSRWAAPQLQQNISSAHTSSNWPNYSPDLLSRGNSYSQRWQSDSTEGSVNFIAQQGCLSFDSNITCAIHTKMRTIMAKTPQDSSFSFSRRYFHWKKNVNDNDDMEEVLTFNSSRLSEDQLKLDELDLSVHSLPSSVPKKKRSIMSVSNLRSAFTFSKSKSGLGTKVICTLFGYRHGHIHVAFQDDAKLSPAFLIELATPTSVLVREMASGVVRIALECDKKVVKKSTKTKLLQEPIWKTYCNGKKYGYATKCECGLEEWKVLNAVGPITNGAGVLPVNKNCESEAVSEGELMYMRAKFERVVGSRDSEAFYMINPDGNGGPQISIYLLRV